MNGDFSDKLNQLLSNPTMMAQIKALADTMMEDSASTGTNSQSETTFSPQSSEKKATTAVPTFFKPSPTFERNMANTCALLTALKPFLDEKRCEKIDKMLSMIHFAEMAGQLSHLL